MYNRSKIIYAGSVWEAQIKDQLGSSKHIHENNYSPPIVRSKGYNFQLHKNIINQERNNKIRPRLSKTMTSGSQEI